MNQSKYREGKEEVKVVIVHNLWMVWVSTDNSLEVCTTRDRDGLSKTQMRSVEVM